MVRNNIVCIVCPKGCRMQVESNHGEIKNISGFSCPKGKEYAEKEFTHPTRVLPTSVRVKHGELPLVPVKTNGAIPKESLLPAMREVAKVQIEAPVCIGQVIVENIMGTGIDIVATRDILRKAV